jgi:hypothetical protein
VGLFVIEKLNNCPFLKSIFALQIEKCVDEHGREKEVVKKIMQKKRHDAKIKFRTHKS